MFLNFYKKYTFYFLTLIGCFIGLGPASSYAQENSVQAHRQEMIEQTLDCAHQYVDDAAVSWQDVCAFDYTKNAGGRPKTKAQIISKELDWYEKTHEKELKHVEPEPEIRSQKKVVEFLVPEENLPETLPTKEFLLNKHKKQNTKDGQSISARINFGQKEEDPSGMRGRVDISKGIRKDDFTWTLSADTADIAMETAWSNLSIWQLAAKGDVEFANHYVLDGSVAYGLIFNGDNRESEYLADGRAFEFLRIEAESQDGNTVDLSSGFGYRHHIRLNNGFFELSHFSVMPLIGYSYHEQNLETTEGDQVVDVNNFYGLGPFSGLSNEYKARWQGPWVGLELAGQTNKLFSAFRMEYHWADYYAQGDFSLRTDLQHPKSFEHNSEGNGLLFNYQVNYELSKNWDVSFNARIQDWEATGGTDTLFRANGTTMESRINQIDWESQAFMMGTTYHFN